MDLVGVGLTLTPWGGVYNGTRFIAGGVISLSLAGYDAYSEIAESNAIDGLNERMSQIEYNFISNINKKTALLHETSK